MDQPWGNMAGSSFCSLVAGARARSLLGSRRAQLVLKHQRTARCSDDPLATQPSDAVIEAAVLPNWPHIETMNGRVIAST